MKSFFLSCVILSITCLSSHASDTIRLQQMIPQKVSCFSLSDIRLLQSDFKKIEELDHQYLLQLDPDKLAAWFRREAGLTPKASPYPSWESEPVGSVGALPGHIMGFYLSAASMMYASTGDERLKEKLQYTINELYECQQANGNGYLLPTVNGKHVFEDVAAGNFTTKNPTINDAFEPTYVMNKIMLGLFSVYQYCGISKAKEIDIAMADWFGSSVIDKLSHDQMQKLLFCEHGSLNESFVQVYKLTGNKKYLDWAKRITDEMMFTPLSQNKDVLTGQHANTQIPKFTGFENVYDYSGEKPYADAALNFWKTVTTNRSWAIGGNSTAEHFFDPSENDKKVLETGGPESCNSVNMMRLTERLYQDHAMPSMIDYYERVLYNHILANYNPENGQCVYYTTMRPGGYKVYGLPFKTFWCCSGTGLEAPAKFGQMIYAHDDQSLYVNLFIPSEVNWQERGIKLTQQTSFPDADESSLQVSVDVPQQMKLCIRKPDWISGNMEITINGKKWKQQQVVNNYIVIDRTWKNGDVIKVHLPMALKATYLPNSINFASFAYGPIVMAAKVDNQGLEKKDFNQEKTTVATKVIPVTAAPALIGNIKSVESGFVRDKNQPLLFTNTKDQISLVPFNSIHFNRYAVYLKVYENDAAYQAEKMQSSSAESNLANVDSQTFDRVKVGDSASETQHKLEGVSTNSGGSNGWRDANNGGYFMYEMKLPQNGQSKLYIVFSGNDDGPRMFDILIDGRLLQRFDHRKKMLNESGLYPVIIPLPENLTNNKKTITVKFAALNHNTAGGVFDVRILQ